MAKNIYTTNELLRELDIQYYVLDYWVRTGQVKPLADGRRQGRERRFTKEEFEKAKDLARYTQSKRRNEGRAEHVIE